MKKPIFPRGYLPTLFPALAVAVIHLWLSVIVGNSANSAWQHRFDTGEPPIGADATVIAIDRILALPLPTLATAPHPVYGLGKWWRIGTIVNSIVWGAAIYGLYRLGQSLFDRQRDVESAI